MTIYEVSSNFCHVDPNGHRTMISVFTGGLARTERS